MTGWSAGFTFWYTGGVGIWGGKSGAALAMADCTSWAAASVERELDRDGGQALGARRRHRVDAGDRGELLLERRGDRRGHRLRARPGQRRLNLDRRKVHVGQIADRQQAIRHDAEDEDCRHQQRREDRTPDVELGVHCSPWGAPIWPPELFKRRGLRPPRTPPANARTRPGRAVARHGIATGWLIEL